MHVHLINPNTTAAMTESIGQAGRAIAAPGTRTSASHPASGPASIEGHFDEAISAVGIIDEILRLERNEQIDAYIIACFGDPGLLAAREMTSAPVIGVAEAAFHLASLIATRFSVVTTLSRTGIIAEHLLDQYGFRNHCRRVRATDIPVLDLEDDSGSALEKIIAECCRARDEDGIGTIVLGCAGMTDLTDTISEEVGLPVVDGVTAAVKLAEALVGLGLKTSKAGDLACPRPKTFTGNFSYLSELDLERR